MKRLILALSLVASPALAQQPDPALMQRIAGSLQQQRNAAYDAQAIAEAKLGLLSEENTKLKAELEQLKKPKEAKKDAK